MAKVIFEAPASRCEFITGVAMATGHTISTVNQYMRVKGNRYTFTSTRGTAKAIRRKGK